MGRKLCTVEEDVYMMKFYGGEVYNTARVMSQAFETWHSRGRAPSAHAAPPAPATNARPYQTTFTPVFSKANQPPPPRKSNSTWDENNVPSSAPKDFVELDE
ncbi:hypothetical protein L1049_013027 [Liquidambar formosana]|uniref:Uncharacterized protein n=1 Tax=Liquidambar formosana TaxID=63359 RepID=A0AAP0RKZ7_LIQFO